MASPRKDRRRFFEGFASQLARCASGDQTAKSVYTSAKDYMNPEAYLHTSAKDFGRLHESKRLSVRIALYPVWLLSGCSFGKAGSRLSNSKGNSFACGLDAMYDP
jgi:hypothetical protein